LAAQLGRQALVAVESGQQEISRLLRESRDECRNRLPADHKNHGPFGEKNLIIPEAHPMPATQTTIT
jgi:hypothetical protein